MQADQVKEGYSLLQIIMASAISIFCSGTAVALLTFFLNKRKYRVEVIPAESDSMEKLLSKIKALMAEGLNSEVKINSQNSEIAGLKVLVDVRDKELIRQGDMLKEILVEQGAAQEREKQCQERLSHVMIKLNEYGELHQVNKRLVQDNLRLQGTIDEAKQQESRGK